MCKIPNVNVGIKWLDFNMRGKFSVMLTDGRQIIVPVSMSPDIKHMSQKHRNEWMILDHQYFTFEHMTRVYSILDIMNINQPAAQFFSTQHRYNSHRMTALPTIYITLYNRLTHNDLGGVLVVAQHRRRHITSHTEPSAGVRQGNRRKALCVCIYP